MSNPNNEAMLDSNFAYSVFYTEKAISILSIIFSIYVMYISCRFKTENQINYIIKLQIAISSIIHMIPYLLPAQEQGFQQENYKSPITFICSFETSLFSVTHYNLLSFPTFLTYIVYLSFKNPDKIEKNEKILKWGIPFFLWIINSIGGVFIYIFSVKGTGDDLVCWFSGKYEIIAHFVFAILCLGILMVFLIKIKSLLLSMIKTREIKEDSGNEYIKSLNKFLFFIWISGVSLVVELIANYVLHYLNKEKMVYFFLFYITSILDLLLYPIIVLIFCYTKVPFNQVFSCLIKQKKSDETLISLFNQPK